MPYRMQLPCQTAEVKTKKLRARLNEMTARTRMGGHSLTDTEAIVLTPPTEFAEVVHLDSLFKHRENIPLVVRVLELVPAMHGTARLPSSCPPIIANVDAQDLATPARLDADAVRCVPKDFLRGLDNEMMIAIVNVHEDSGRVLLRLDRFHFRFVALCGFQVGRIFRAGNEDTCLFPCDFGDFPPVIASVMVIVVSVEIAPNMAHFVEEGVAELLLRSIVKVGNLDRISRSPPIRLTEGTARVRDDEIDFRHIVVEHDAVELFVPRLELCDSDLHILGVYDYTLL